MDLGPESRVPQKIGPCVSYWELSIAEYTVGTTLANYLEFRRENKLNCSLTVFIQIYIYGYIGDGQGIEPQWQLRWWYFATLVGCECMVLILVTIIMHAHLCVAVTTILQCNRTHKTQTNADTNYNTHNFCKTSVVDVLPSLLCCTLLLCSLLCCTISTASVL